MLFVHFLPLRHLDYVVIDAHAAHCLDGKENDETVVVVVVVAYCGTSRPHSATVQ